MGAESYALKQLSKGHVMKTGTKSLVLNERNILALLNSIFIVKLHETYNSGDCLYFLLEPALGGELYDVYIRQHLHGKTPHCKFYVSGVVFAFEHMHSMQVIYRDLKPENILITGDGQPKITDMGLAKHCVGKTFTSCGTPDYFAPEIIMASGHSFPVDWWCLGVLIFELLAAHAPFEAVDPISTFQNVKKGIDAVQFPSECRGPAETLIKALLKSEPNERLPLKPGGVENIQKHSWYCGFDWPAMSKQTLTPPYIPDGVSDASNFNASEDDRPPMLPYEDDGSGWDIDFATCPEEPPSDTGGMFMNFCCAWRG